MGHTYALTIGTTMMMIRTQIPTAIMTRIFMSFHHICLRTRLALRRKPWADTAKLSNSRGKLAIAFQSNDRINAGARL